MENKKLTVRDFPFSPPEVVKAGFRGAQKTKLAARILMDALFDVVADIDDIDAWRRVAKNSPELAEFTRDNPGIKVSFNHINEEFTIQPQ